MVFDLIERIKQETLSLLRKPIQHLEKPIQPQEWTLQENEIYQTQIYKRGTFSHVLWLAYHPENVGVVNPITEEQRNLMWYPKTLGPLEAITFDTDLMILRQDYAEALPVFIAYFINGRFMYAEGHGPGLGDIRSLAQDYHTAEQFKARLQQYFKIPSSKEFSRFFIHSNLPEPHKNSVKELLQ